MPILVMFEEWTERAACRDADDPDIFFPDRNAVAKAEAKAFCERCEVSPECYNAGRTEGFGIWGGEPAAERGFTPTGRRKRGGPGGDA